MFPHRLKNVLLNDWLIALYLLVVFLLTNGYQYGWDDQHLEIPLLKSLIDPHLYPGDYYVESLKQNFTSFFYPLLARFINVGQVPTAYFTLYLISRYVLFLFWFKLWRLIARERFAAFACVAASIVLMREQEFLYRTFSHQEFTIAIVFAGIYYFYRDRFLLAAAILGVATNFHALYSVFPMFYLMVFLIWQQRKHGWKVLLRSVVIYLTAALPFIAWNVQKFLAHRTFAPPGPQEWIPLFLLACPQNFLFREIPYELIFRNATAALLALRPFLTLALFYLLNALHNPEFRRDRRVQTVALSATLLLLVSFVFSYLHPVRFVVDLNLVRNTQFLSYFLMGYTLLAVIQTCRRSNLLGVLLSVSAVSLLYLDDIIKILAAGVLIFSLFLDKTWSGEKRPGKIALILLWGTLTAACGFGIWKTARLLNLEFRVVDEWVYGTGLLAALALLSQLRRKWLRFPDLKKYFFLVPIVVMTCSYMHIHYTHLQAVKNKVGFWALQDSWEDMQRYVRDHTPKNAYILAPNDMEMGGFRILSERKILVCYRDCGIIGFDYQAAREWQRRLNDIQSFKVLLDRAPGLESALVKAVQTYKVNYVVFMRYYAPPASLPGFTKMYENEHFSLFEVKLNPVPAPSSP